MDRALLNSLFYDPLEESGSPISLPLSFWSFVPLFVIIKITILVQVVFDAHKEKVFISVGIQLLMARRVWTKYGF